MYKRQIFTKFSFPFLLETHSKEFPIDYVVESPKALAVKSSK